MDLVIRGGQLVDGSIADIGVAGERIVQIGGELSAPNDIDAHGKLLLPGGVDAHVHLSSPPIERSGPAWVDDFTSGSAAALAGGITTVGNMTFGAPGESLLQALERETAVARRASIADVFLHPVLASPDADNLAEIARLGSEGCSSMKVFLTNPHFNRDLDGHIEAIRRAGEAGVVSMLHCEDAATIAFATRQLVSQGKTSLRYFGESRPVIAEVVATQRALAIAELTGAPVYIVHLSSARALALCAVARARGLHVYVETRPLYLYLTSERLQTPEAGKFVGQPPLREHSDVDALWTGLRSGIIDTVCTDHAPWSLQAKLDPAHDIEHLRPGVENLQLLLPMLYSEGVRTGRISLSRLVELSSSNAAKLFGLYPRKGAIAVGSDADLVIFDPDLERTVTAAMLKSNADYSVYEGWRVTGWPTVTIRRGEIVFRDDLVIGQAGSGQVLSCGRGGVL
ncbi:MAG: amidohydrolase family protein [Chloroflexi bacterium]|nr:amidohydrolase family protein [Chloroflexota bacterium]